MEKLFEKRVRVTVYMGVEQHEKLYIASGGNVSKFMRELAALHFTPNRDGKPSSDTEPELPRYGVMLSKQAKSQKKAKTCIHGTERGSNCWKCGGAAKIE